jgi:hypothetical protein
MLLTGNAGAGIGDGNYHMRPVRPQLQTNLSLFRELKGIGQQVRDHLQQTLIIRLDRANQLDCARPIKACLSLKAGGVGLAATAVTLSRLLTDRQANACSFVNLFHHSTTKERAMPHYQQLALRPARGRTPVVTAAGFKAGTSVPPPCSQSRSSRRERRGNLDHQP